MNPTIFFPSPPWTVPLLSYRSGRGDIRKLPQVCALPCRGSFFSNIYIDELEDPRTACKRILDEVRSTPNRLYSVVHYMDSAPGLEWYDMTDPVVCERIITQFEQPGTTITKLWLYVGVVPTV